MTAYAASDPDTKQDSTVPNTLGRLRDLEAIIGRHSVGRIAFAVGDRVSILPLQYMYTGGWIYGRTVASPSLRDLLKNRRVAFEVDEHNSLMEWTSVVIRGPLYLIDAGPGSDQSGEQLFRIRVVEISGRSSTPARGKRRDVSTWRPISG